MGRSTDGILFYGYHFSEDHADEEKLVELTERWVRKGEPPLKVEVSAHCSGDYPMYYVYIPESRVQNSRGYPQQVDPHKMMPIPLEWHDALADFIMDNELTPPGTKGEASYDDSTSEFGWWLVSYWG